MRCNRAPLYPDVGQAHPPLRVWAIDWTSIVISYVHALPISRADAPEPRFHARINGQIEASGMHNLASACIELPESASHLFV